MNSENTMVPLLNDIDPDENFFNEVYGGLSENGSLYYSVTNVGAAIGAGAFSIVSLNIRSFRKNYDVFQAVLSSANVSPDIMVFSETWLSEPVDIDGYVSFHSFRCERRSGGISVFIKDIYPANIMADFSVVNDTIESCAVRISLQNFFFNLVAIYRPHSDSISNFSDHLNSILGNDSLKDNSLLIGDFNINLLDQESNEVVYFSSTMRTFNFMPLITKPTRFPADNLNQSVSLIDHIWSNFSYNCIERVGILIDNTTDHCTSFLVFSKAIIGNNNLSDSIEVKFRLINSENFCKFEHCVSAVDWRIINEYNDVNIATLFFLRKINDIYCKCFPLKVKKISKKRMCKPWLTSEVLKLVKYKSKCFKDCKLGLISHNDNRKVRNYVNNTVRKAKLRYYKEVFLNNMNDIKRTWKDIRKIVSSCVKNHSVSSVNFEGRTVTDETEIAECFCEHFRTIATKIDGELPPASDDPLSYIQRNDHSMFMEPVSEAEVSEIILSIRNTKCDLNSVSVSILKRSRLFLKLPITLIVNKSISSGVFPDILKKAIVVPIFKKGDKANVANYRPISTLPTLSKIIEKCVVKRLLSFTDRFSIFCRNQFGFMRGLSTTDAIIDLTEFIYGNLESKNHTIGVFIDYSKAFDTVNHDILLRKLEMYGIRGLVHDWFRSYLNNRTISVKIKNTMSENFDLRIGIPQGSVLGPILFVLYVNEFPNISPSLKTVLFADDTTVSMSGPDFPELCEGMNAELEKILRWSVSNRLALNSQKTGAVVFSNRLHDDDRAMFLTIDNANVCFLDDIKFLGITLDNKLKFKEHISNVCLKLSKAVGIMFRLKNFLPQKSLIGLYYNFVYPYLLYGNIVWAGTYSTHLHTIEMIQKKVIRIVTGSDYLEHTQPLFHKTEILKFDDLHRFLLLLYFYKNRDGFSVSNHSYNTRHHNDPLIEIHRLTSTEQSVRFSAVKAWLSIPTEIKNIATFNRFKFVLKKYFVNNYMS